MRTKKINWMGETAILACDGRCKKAWGINKRPKVHLGIEDDDFAMLSDGELGEAPDDPGTYEGGCAKPMEQGDMNKWCSRECERSVIANTEDDLTLPDYSQRRLNMPWKH